MCNTHISVCKNHIFGLILLYSLFGWYGVLCSHFVRMRFSFFVNAFRECSHAQFCGLRKYHYSNGETILLQWLERVGTMDIRKKFLLQFCVLFHHVSRYYSWSMKQDDRMRHTHGISIYGILNKHITTLTDQTYTLFIMIFNEYDIFKYPTDHSFRYMKFGEIQIWFALLFSCLLFSATAKSEMCAQRKSEQKNCSTSWIIVTKYTALAAIQRFHVNNELSFTCSCSYFHFFYFWLLLENRRERNNAWIECIAQILFKNGK